MPTDIVALIDVLEAAEAIYRQLLPLFKDEKEAAFNSEPHRLSSIVSEKEALLVQLDGLERRRRQLMHRIADAWQIPETEMHLSRLAENAEASQASAIRRLQRSLGDMVRKVKQANEENRLLIQHCLHLVNGALGFLQHWMMPTDVYKASGRMDPLNRNGRLVSGAI